jgi:hypothetical protein
MVSSSVNSRRQNPCEPSEGRPEVVVVLGLPVDRTATTAWCDEVRSLLRGAPGAMVSCDVRELSGSAAEVVDALARLRLVALGCGGQIRLRRADPALRVLLDLLGFADLLPPDPPEPGVLRRRLVGIVRPALRGREQGG